MHVQTRASWTYKNIKFNLINQVIILIVNFISRTLFIRFLGAEFLGINGLYSNILTVLSLAELGIGNVMTFSLYRPLAENNITYINDLLTIYKKIYHIIAIGIAFLGIIMLPFLDLIVNSTISLINLRFYYILYLCNSIASYLVIYKTILLNADQKCYITNSCKTLFIVLQNILQIIFLYFTTNYFTFLSLQLLFTICQNFTLSHIANKIYPFCKLNNKKAAVPKHVYNEISNNIKAMFLYKLAVIIINNTDNILISIIKGTVFVGYYSNYCMIINTLTTFISMVITGMQASLGNLNALNDKKRSYEIFKVLILFFNIITIFCISCLVTSLQDFIDIWLGAEYRIDVFAFNAILINFYISNIVNPVWIYRESLGLFRQIKYIMMLTAVINIVLSVILGRIYGLGGIIIATALARILTVVWYEPIVLYKAKFEDLVRHYFSLQGKLIFNNVIIVLLSLYICRRINSTLLGLFIRVIICGFIVLLIESIFMWHTQEGKQLKEIVIRCIRHK